jgi:ligand-binding sensor domain-containing protein
MGGSNSDAVTPVRALSGLSRTVCSTRLAIVSGCLVLMLPSGSWALDPRTSIAQYATDRLQAADGLPQATVGAITQTRDGYIWMATEEGVARFDGIRLAVFDNSNSKLALNYISNVQSSRDGSLWIRTADTLYRYRDGDVSQACAARSVGLDYTPIL